MSCLHPQMSIVVRQESDDLYIVCVVDWIVSFKIDYT